MPSNISVLGCTLLIRSLEVELVYPRVVSCALKEPDMDLFFCTMKIEKEQTVEITIDSLCGRIGNMCHESRVSVKEYGPVNLFKKYHKHHTDRRKLCLFSISP